ncbi:MAG: hypothetical protein N2510_01685 [Ignavibacteria bacterium]|nr:hypothetical protein [Ignavibacteria bacterium]
MVETDQEKEYPYNFHVRSESIFHLLDRIDSEEENNLMLRVALPQAISYTRVYISNNSAYSPLKRYMLPIIDLNNLIEQKVKSFLENISVKNKTRRRKLKIK